MILLLGASASGKTEIAKYLASHFGIKKAITTTTRPIRVHEKDGVDYFFLTKEAFLNRLSYGQFVEHTLYNENYYGTGKDQVKNDRCIVLDPKGVFSFQALNNPSVVSFYLEASEETRRKRMETRGDKAEDIEKRISNDRNSFAPSSLPKTDFVLNTNEKSIGELANTIYSLYQETLKKRGVE